MFRLSLREILFLTLIVALITGWVIDRRQLTTANEREAAMAQKWRLCAGAFEHWLKSEGWRVDWELDRANVVISRDGGMPRGVQTDGFPPSVDFP